MGRGQDRIIQVVVVVAAAGCNLSAQILKKVVEVLEKQQDHGRAPKGARKCGVACP